MQQNGNIQYFLIYKQAKLVDANKPMFVEASLYFNLLFDLPFYQQLNNTEKTLMM